MLENDPIQEDGASTTADAVVAGGAAVAVPPRLNLRAIDGVTAAVALLVALAGGGLYAMHVRTSAGLQRMAAVDASRSDIDNLLSGGRESIAALSRSVRSTRDLVNRFTTHTGPVAVEPQVQLASAMHLPGDAAVGPRDPFTFKAAELAPQDAPAAATGVSPAQEHEQQRLEALTAARQLQVQSIIHGSSRKACLINAKLYFEGQAVDERFTVQSISPDAVIVRSGEFRFELKLRK